MPRRALKRFRRGIALVVLTLFLAGFTDFRGFAPAQFTAHALAHLQFTPSFIALTAGTTLAAGFVFIIVLTLLLGRVYCSTLCPLGLLQDAVARIASWLRPRRKPLPFRSGSRWLRYGMLAATVLAILGGAGAIAYTHADPYSNFGRIASGLFRPLVVVANNALVAPASALGISWLYRVEPPWPGPGVLLPASFVLALVVLLAARRERIYCNTLCPVGTVLGLIARVSAFRLTIDRAACNKCAKCLRTCKAQCLDLRSGTIDASRCVACLNCVAACPEHGIRHGFAWKRRSRRAPSPVVQPPSADPQRRAFIAGAATLLLAPATAVRAATATVAPLPPRAPATPPGSGSVARFLELCTGCQLCVSACPTHVLQPAFLEYGFAGLMKPRLDFEKAFCNYDCLRCGEVCPTGAILLLPLADKQLTSVGVARFTQSRCIVDKDGTDCAACSEHCPTKAVETVPFRENLRLPQVNEDLCIGCGACEYACPVRPERAIAVAARPKHTRATKAVDTAPARKPTTGNFPF